MPSTPYCCQTLCAIAWLISCLTPPCVTAGEHDDYLHGKVVVITWDAKFHLPDGVVGTAELGNVYTIDKVNGPWLWVTSAGGWISADDVIKFSEAEDYFTAKVTASPTSENHFNRGMARLSMDQIDLAMEDFEAAIELSKSPTYFNARGIAWLRKGEWEKSISDHTEAVRMNPRFSAAYYNRGNAFMALKEYDKAIADYNLALRLNDKNGRAYVNRGQCWHQKRHYKKAIEDYDVACEMNPRWPLAFNNRADSYTRIREFAKAIEDCNVALKYQPDFTWAMTNRGNAYMGLGEFEKAVADFNAALEIDPEFAPAFHNRGNVQATQKEWIEAMHDYKKAIEADPEFAPPYNAWAWILATCPEPQLRDPKQAVELAEKACRLNGLEWNHFGTLAAAYAGQGDWKRATKAQRRAIAMLPETASDDERQAIAARLTLYESEQPYVEE